MVKHQCLDRVRNSDDWVFNGIQPPIYGDITWYNNHQCMGISWKMVNLMGYEWDSRDSIHVYKKCGKAMVKPLWKMIYFHGELFISISWFDGMWCYVHILRYPKSHGHTNPRKDRKFCFFNCFRVGFYQLCRLFWGLLYGSRSKWWGQELSAVPWVLVDSYLHVGFLRHWKYP